jgi:hypothetical protein
VEVAARADRLGLLASAIAGRRISVAVADPATPSWTDGVTIFLDAGLGAAELIQAAAVQASLLGAGSLAPDLIASLLRRADATSRYLAVEGRRALASSPVPLPLAVMSLLRTVEPSSAAESLEIALSRVPVEPAPPVFGQLRPRDIKRSAAGARDDDSPGVMATRQVRHADALTELPDDEPPADAGTDLSSPVGGGGAVGRLLQRLTSATRSHDAGSPGADAGTHFIRTGRTGGRRTVRSSAAAELTDLTAGRVEPIASRYPEWDSHRRSYRANWCTVVERTLPDLGRAAIAMPPTRALRNALSRVGLELAPTRRQLQGNDIDIDAAIAQRVEIASGGAADEAVYIDDQRRQRELSVLILLDVSGSANEPSATGGSVHEHQRTAAAALAFALHELGDRVALLGFRSMGRSNVEAVPIKRFGDPAGALMLRRLAALTPGAYTRLGAAIRHGAAILECDAGTAQRLLVVLSDGFAYDHGYEGRYGEADARRALAEARRAGIGCLCLSIGGVTASEELRRVFGTAAHATLNDSTDLVNAARPLFVAALRSAETHRRQWRRNDRSTARLRIDRRSA